MQAFKTSAQVAQRLSNNSDRGQRQLEYLARQKILTTSSAFARRILCLAVLP